MKLTSNPHQTPLARTLLSLLAVLVISACGTQASTSAPLPASPEIPNTGPGAAAANQAAAPTLAASAGTPSPSPTAAAQASPAAATQPNTTPAGVVTPDCQSPAALTLAQTEGPYFKANSPERTSLIETGTSGTQLVLTGYVLTRDCKPVAHALLDFWQADANGQYDNSGFTLRGHQFSDAQGRFQLVTVIPGLYTGRTEHIHVKVQAPNGPVLTTQLYFPNVPGNQRDSIYNSALLVKLDSNGNPQHATFNFIIQAP